MKTSLQKTLHRNIGTQPSTNTYTKRDTQTDRQNWHPGAVHSFSVMQNKDLIKQVQQHFQIQNQVHGAEVGLSTGLALQQVIPVQLLLQGWREREKARSTGRHCNHLPLDCPQTRNHTHPKIHTRTYTCSHEEAKERAHVFQNEGDGRLLMYTQTYKYVQ